MARTWKYLDRKAMETYAAFADDPNCLDCPFGLEKNQPPWALELGKRLKRKGQRDYRACGKCKRYFKYEITSDTYCPCRSLGEAEAFKMIVTQVEEWREKGLIK